MNTPKTLAELQALMSEMFPGAVVHCDRRTWEVVIRTRRRLRTGDKTDSLFSMTPDPTTHDHPHSEIAIYEGQKREDARAVAQDRKPRCLATMTEVAAADADPLGRTYR